MTGHEKFYRFWRPIITVFTNIFLRLKISGRENIPSGAAVVVANHSSNFDALVMITALGKAGAVRILAKAELYKIPIVGPFLRAIGTIRVDRSVSDINAVKESLAYLKAGGKIGIFPEGRRVSSDEAADAKTGAVKLAEKTGSWILPMYIEPNKRYFRRNSVVIGQAYKLSEEGKKLPAEELAAKSSEMLACVYALKPVHSA